jgi:Zn-dependent protease
MSGMTRDPWKQGMAGGAGWVSRFGGVSRLFGEGEPWLRWGVPVARVAGIRVRVHWLFLVYIAAGLIFTLPHHQSGLEFRLPAMGALFVLVLLHEFGHCLMCRAVGGEADEIVMWPLGGLAVCKPPHDWRSELKVVLAGPTVNAVLLPVLAGVMYLLTRSWAVAVPNPFDLKASVYALKLPGDTMPLWLIVLWSFHAANVVLLLFNLMVPMFPLDGGRILQCVLWRRAGYHRSLWLAAHIGLGAAAALALVGVLAEDGKMLILIAAFGAASCWAERRRMQFLAGADPVVDRAVEVGPEPDEGEADRAEVDRILEKISRVGMGGLSGRERRVLKRATERSRETQESGGASHE